MGENTHGSDIEAEKTHNAARWNGYLALSQIAMAGITANFGFIPEATHNGGDYLSFEAKARAIDEEDTSKADVKRYRKYGAAVLGLTGVAGIVGGAGAVIAGHVESTDTVAVGMAFASATVNSFIVRNTHSHDDESHTASDQCVHKHSDAFLDTKLHTATDFWTGWVYLAGLLGQKYFNNPDIANFAIAGNGLLASWAAQRTFKKISKDHT